MLTARSLRALDLSPLGQLVDISLSDSFQLVVLLRVHFDRFFPSLPLTSQTLNAEITRVDCLDLW